MAVIEFDQQSFPEGKERGAHHTNFAINRRIAPVIQGKTLGVGDTIGLISFSRNSVVIPYLTHQGSDLTFAATFNIAAANNEGKLAKDPNGDPIFIPLNAYYANALAFDSPRVDPFALQRNDTKRNVLSFSEVLGSIATANNNPATHVVLCAVVTAVPTAAFDIQLFGTIRGY